MDVPYNDYLCDTEVCDVVRIKDLESYLTLDDEVNGEIDIFDMTSLGDLVFRGHPQSPNKEDDTLKRLSLAYEKLNTIPKILLEEIAATVQILDLSHNQFRNLDFLGEFKSLTNLICDHNKITSDTILPFLPTLELLWLNHCKMDSLYPWAKRLQNSCPNLKYLSLMGNPMTPFYINEGNFYDYLQYRLFIISLFPKLKHLDDRPVTADQRTEAERLYRKPLIDRLVQKTQYNIPEYLRHVSDIVSDILTPTPAFAQQQERNLIV